MPRTAAAPLSSLDWRYAVHRHLKWSAWWADFVYLSDGDRAAAGEVDRLRAATLREMQARHMPGASLAYLTGLVRGKWVGE